MPKKKTPVEKPAEQFKRFSEAAKEHGVDVDKAERNFRSLSRRDQPKKSLPAPTSTRSKP